MVIPLKSRFLELSAEEFFIFCQEMSDFRIERDADGTILFMSPTGSQSGNLNGEITSELFYWNRQSKLGAAFDSSTGFTFPDESVRSPDSAWIEKSRWEKLTREEQDRFAPIVPDFIIEIRSRTDALETLKDKMSRYQRHGVSLGWLIDPTEKEVWIYRSNGTIDQLQNLDAPLSGEDVLPEFELRISDFW
ncbi:MAG: Uma2 family endonuclease [Bacteroidota bacterium]